MSKILLTGANGQLGRAIRKEYGDSAEFILTDMIEDPAYIRLDISDHIAVMEAARKYKPDTIINCAAYTNVDGCETNEELAFKANAIGPKNLAVAAETVNAKLIHISTDYVFNGKGTRPYVEEDQTDPVSAYGRTKVAGEQYVMDFCHKYFILRTAWLYGDGKNFVKTMIRLSKTHDSVSVVCDQLGSPTSAKELAKMIHYLEPTENYGIFHATCEGDTNWADFTKVIFEKLGIDTEVIRVTSEEYAAMNPASAHRPHYSIMENRMLKLTTDFVMADWEDALDEYLKDLDVESL